MPTKHREYDSINALLDFNMDYWLGLLFGGGIVTALWAVDGHHFQWWWFLYVPVFTVVVKLLTYAAIGIDRRRRAKKDAAAYALRLKLYGPDKARPSISETLKQHEGRSGKN